MRPGCLSAHLTRPDGEEDDRLPCLDGISLSARESPPVSKVLAIEGDYAGGLVVHEAAHELARLEVGLVAERGEAREAEPVVLGEKSELKGKISALRHERDRPALQLAPAEIEARGRVEDPETVRAEKHGARLADPLDDRGLASTPVGARLAEAGRDPDERLGSCSQRSLDSVFETLCGNGKDDQVWRVRKIGERRVRLAPENLAAVSVHEIDGAVLFAAKRAKRKAIAPLRRVVRRPENRDGAGIEKRPEVPRSEERRVGNESG